MYACLCVWGGDDKSWYIVQPVRLELDLLLFKTHTLAAPHRKEAVIGICKTFEIVRHYELFEYKYKKIAEIIESEAQSMYNQNSWKSFFSSF